jgi:DNA-binding CsgD family transcriptional regulator
MYAHQKKGKLNIKESVHRIHQIINLAKNKKDTVLLMHVLTNFVDILQKAGRRTMSLAYNLEAYKLLPYVDINLYKKLGSSTEFELVTTLYKTGDYKKTIELLDDSRFLKGEDHSAMLACDLWAQLCFKLGDLECSSKKIEEAENIYIKSDTNSWYFRGWRGIFEGNRGKIELQKNRIYDAISRFENAILITKQAELFDNVAQFGLLLSECYIKTEQWDKLAQIYSDIKHAIQFQVNPTLLRDFHKLKIMLNARSGNYKKVKTLMDSIEQYNELIQIDLETERELSEQLSYEITEYQRNESEIQYKIDKQIKIRNIFLLMITLLVFIGGLVTYNKHKEIQKQKELSAKIQMEKEFELESAQRELQNIKQILISKTQEIENLENSLDHDGNGPRIEELKQSLILTEEDWVRFKNLFEKQNPGYLERLKVKFTDLTQAQTRYFLLIKIGLNKQEMAATLGVSAGALRTLKSRLLNKLELPETTDLETLAESI